MKKAIILSSIILSATIAFSQVSINKDGSDPNPNSILHVKGSGVHALYVDYANGYIGLNNIIPSYRLHLLETVTDTKNYGSVFEITGGSTSSEKYAGVYSYINGTGGVNRAFEGLSYGTNPNDYNIGLSGFAKNAKNNYGLQGQTMDANSITSGNNIGTITEADNCDWMNIGLYSIGYGGGSFNFGVYAKANEDNPGVNYGIYAVGANTGPGAGDYWSGYFYGKLNVDGSIYQNGAVIHAKDLLTINNASEKVMKFIPVSYLNDDNELIYGFDAEAMKNTIPEIVKDVATPVVPGDENTSVEMSTSVNISAMLPIFAKAIQELNEKVENLEAENNLLKKEINKLKSDQ
ncbi:MAG: hypothetical protein K8R86_10775 [Bacteroidales bacterium]|nr:hypothetical protein [Bacteroidales bacterium]